MIDPAPLQATILARLPSKVRWTLNDVPMDYDFSAASRGLRPLSASALNCKPKATWLELLIFGEYDYAEGGGANPFLGVHRETGVVYGLDVERAQPVFLLNSSIDRFVDTFLYLSRYWGAGQDLPDDADSILRQLDPDAYPTSDWKALAAYVREEAG